MVQKEVLAKFLKLSTDRIYAGLDENKWDAEGREAALYVLKNRKKDISKYLDAEVEESAPSEAEIPVENKKPEVPVEKLTELTTLITEELDKNDQKMIDAIYSVVGEGQNLQELPEETIDCAIKLIKDRRAERKIEKKRQERNAPTPSFKNLVLSEEKQKIADEILARKDLTKKQKLLEMWNQGLDRSETLSLHFMDPTYIYDLYREVSK